jgi:hypothetical protein
MFRHDYNGFVDQGRLGRPLALAVSVVVVTMPSLAGNLLLSLSEGQPLFG